MVNLSFFFVGRLSIGYYFLKSDGEFGNKEHSKASLPFIHPPLCTKHKTFGRLPNLLKI
jgi:hypothetical protein